MLGDATFLFVFEVSNTLVPFEAEPLPLPVLELRAHDTKLLVYMSGSLRLYAFNENDKLTLEFTWSIEGEIEQLAFFDQDHLVLVKDSDAGGVFEIRQLDAALSLVSTPLPLVSRKFNDLVIQGDVAYLATEQKDAGDPAGLERVVISGLAASSLGVEAIAGEGASALWVDKELLYVAPLSLNDPATEPLLYAYTLDGETFGDLTPSSTLSAAPL